MSWKRRPGIIGGVHAVDHPINHFVMAHIKEPNLLPSKLLLMRERRLPGVVVKIPVRNPFVMELITNFNQRLKMISI
jgi:hypothetical protein